MRYVAYAAGGERRLGVRVENGLRRIGPLPRNGEGLVRAAAELSPETARTLPEESEAWEPALPVFPDTRVVCLGLNYAEHAREGGSEPPDYPAFFLRVDTSLLRNGGEVPVPKVSDKLDWEAELVAVIGKSGRYIPEAQALDHVFGYTVFNDISVRDYQRLGRQWTPGKNFDATGVIGEEIVTADELPDGARGLRIRAILNGEVMQDADTSMMLVSVAQAVALVSDFMTLRPGDLIAMGTPSGVGYARTPPVWLRDGDEIAVEVERVGRISARVRGHA